jgi:hypothetical protein
MLGCVLALLLQDVLGHPHTKAFVSHCGMHSVNEAAYHGVPLVALPFQFEQVCAVLLKRQETLFTSAGVAPVRFADSPD